MYKRNAILLALSLAACQEIPTANQPAPAAAATDHRMQADGGM